jgi:hypothetical protein
MLRHLALIEQVGLADFAGGSPLGKTARPYDDKMTTLSDAAVLADKINSQARQHPRISMLRVPQAEVRGDDIVIALYWLDREQAEARDSVIRFADNAHLPAEQAATQILDDLVTDSRTPPAR